MSSSETVENYNPNQKRNKLGQWTKENYNNEIDKYLRGEYKSADRLKVIDHPSEHWLNAGLQDAEIFLTGATYDKSTKGKHNVSEETMRNLPDLLDNPQYIFKSSTVPGSYVGVLDDYEEENGVKKPLIAVVKPEQGKVNVNLIPSVYGKDPDFPYREVFKNNLLYERPQNNKTVSNNIVTSIVTETLKRSSNIITDVDNNFNPKDEEMLNRVDNAIIQLGDTDDTGKGRKFKSRFIQAGIAGYPEKFGNVLVKKETLDKFINTMIGVPVIINHKDLTEDNVNDERVGTVSNVWYDDKDGWYWCDGIIWNETAQSLITDNGWSVSCSYDVKLADDTGGTENNIKYDMEFLDGVFTHLALVDNPRYERANIVFNSKTVENDKWITIGADENHTGRHILVKDGETKEEAVQKYWNHIKAKRTKEEIFHKKWTSDEDLKTFAKVHTYLPKTFSDFSEDEYVEYLKDIGATSYKDFKKKIHSSSIPGVIKHYGEWRINKLSKRLKALKELQKLQTVKNYDPNQKRNKLGQWTKNEAIIQQKKDNLQPIEVNKDNIPSFASKKELGDWFSSIFEDLGSVKISDTGVEVDLYKSNAEREASKRRLQQEPNKAVGVKFSEMVEKSIKIDERPKDERHKHNQEQYYNKLKLGKDLYDVDIFVDYLEPNDEYRYAGHKTTQIDNEISVRDTQVINHILLTKTDKKSTRDLQPIKIKVMHTKVDTSIITDNSKDFNPTGEKILNNIKENNAKERDMALLEELKKLISNVENDKGEKMDKDKEMDNAKVDKRDIIRQIMAIAGKHEDNEDVRTIAKLAEKLAYDKSEAGTADNKCKNEDDENKKEDKEKYEEFKEEVKEDVENRKKCDNNVDNSKINYFEKMNEIYNASQEAPKQDEYISQADRLKAGEEYFS